MGKQAIEEAKTANSRTQTQKKLSAKTQKMRDSLSLFLGQCGQPKFGTLAGETEERGRDGTEEVDKGILWLL
jgi:hypothetical protein